jgi:hypothetical protein
MRAALELELNRSVKGRLRHLSDEDRAALNKMLDASVNRVLHGPTLRLRQAAAVRSSEALTLEQLTMALAELFQLSAGEPLPDDTDLSEEDALISAPEASPPTAETSEDREQSALPSGKRRPHSEAP